MISEKPTEKPDTKLETLKAMIDLASKVSAPLDLHKKMAQDLTDITVIVEEWHKIKAINKGE